MAAEGSTIAGADSEGYSDILIRKVKILRGAARQAALDKGATEDDLVILRIGQYHSEPEYGVEIVKGDPLEYLLRQKK